MFIAIDENTKEITKLISSSKKLDCAVAFLGGRAPELLGKKGGRVICNLASSGTNPSAVEQLHNEKYFLIKQLSDLHAKIYIGDDYGIVSSANLSANGLGLEDDELNGWREAGYKVTNKSEVERMRDWFEKLWEDASSIDQDDIDQAKTRWLKHRKNRLFTPSQEKNSFLEELKSNPLIFRDRGIYLTITTDRMSDKAEKNLADIKKREPLLSKVLDAYEDWPSLPNDAYLIDLYLNRGRPNYLSLSRSPSVDDPLSKIETSNLFLCYKEMKILGFEISKVDKTELKGKVKELWEDEQIGEKDEDAKLIKLEDALKILLS